MRPIIGKREIWKSLDTADHKEALKRMRRASVDVDARFEAARRRLSNSANPASNRPTDTELEQLVLEWFRDRHRKSFRDFDSPSPDDPYPREIVEALARDEADLVEEAQRDSMARAQHFAGRLLAQRKIDRANLSQQQFWMLVRLIHRGLVENVRRSQARYNGHLQEQCYDGFFRDPVLGQSIALSVNVSAAPRPTLRELVERYHQDPRRVNVLKRTQEENELALSVLKELLGDDQSADQVTRDHFRRARDVLIRLPPNARKRFPKLTLKEAEAMASLKRLTALHP